MRQSSALTLLTFALTLLVSAALLFLVELTIAKRILPLLGGTPAVWNTCSVFFQAVLLAGYAYAHTVGSRLELRQQLRLHAVVLALPLLPLLYLQLDPTFVADNWMPPPGGSNPIPWLLGLLTVTVGLPLLVISTSAPLLQKWFAQTGHEAAKDPYFLYAASNLGSMLGLAAYPLYVERYFTLPQQGLYWALGYCALLGLTLACLVRVAQSPAPRASAAQPDTKIRASGSQARPGSNSEHVTARGASAPAEDHVSPWQRLHWIALAAVPSSLMLGVTTYISTDVASFPLMWAVPLGLYLLSFIIVFSRIPAWVHKGMVLVMPVLMLLLVFLLLANWVVKVHMTTQIAFHLITFFVVCMVCHGELARRRPSTRHLTEFYLLMSLGGVVGGMFNGLLAPVLFPTVLEYQLAVLAACLLLPALEAEATGKYILRFENAVASFLRGKAPWLLPDPSAPPTGRVTNAVLDVLLPLALGGITLTLLNQLNKSDSREFLEWIQGKLEAFANLLRRDAVELNLTKLRVILQLGIPAVLCYSFVGRPVRFGLGVTAIVLAYMSYPGYEDTPIHQERSFFGVLRVKDDGNYHELIHGTTLHGQQRYIPDPVDEDGLLERNEALTYYHGTGPIGYIFRELYRREEAPPVAFIGLGTGTLASYTVSGQSATFYEIDAKVERIARNPKYFTFVTDAEKRGANLKIVLGDARLKLREAPAHGYKLIVVDAFSSDAIPVHLLTREAVQLYFEKAAEDGLVALHISNRHLNLEPVAKAIADSLGLASRIMDDRSEDIPGKTGSDWVILARNDKALGELALHEDPLYQRRTQLGAVLAGLSQGAVPVAAATLLDTDKARWVELTPDKEVGVWTDDFSNILGVFYFR